MVLKYIQQCMLKVNTHSYHWRYIIRWMFEEFCLCICHHNFKRWLHIWKSLNGNICSIHWVLFKGLCFSLFVSLLLLWIYLGYFVFWGVFLCIWAIPVHTPFKSVTNVVTHEGLIWPGCGDGRGDHQAARRQCLSNVWSLKPSDPQCLACSGQS